LPFVPCDFTFFGITFGIPKNGNRIMPKKAKELSAIEAKRIIKPGRHAVGGAPGLLLVVKDTGA
jgi:hypothetical protein